MIKVHLRLYIFPILIPFVLTLHLFSLGLSVLDA